MKVEFEKLAEDCRRALLGRPTPQRVAEGLDLAVRLLDQHPDLGILFLWSLSRGATNTSELAASYCLAQRSTQGGWTPAYDLVLADFARHKYTSTEVRLNIASTIGARASTGESIRAASPWVWQVLHDLLTAKPQLLIDAGIDALGALTAAGLLGDVLNRPAAGVLRAILEALPTSELDDYQRDDVQAAIARIDDSDFKFAVECVAPIEYLQTSVEYRKIAAEGPAGSSWTAAAEAGVELAQLLQRSSDAWDSATRSMTTVHDLRVFDRVSKTRLGVVGGILERFERLLIALTPEAQHVRFEAVVGAAGSVVVRFRDSDDAMMSDALDRFEALLLDLETGHSALHESFRFLGRTVAYQVRALVETAAAEKVSMQLETFSPASARFYRQLNLIQDTAASVLHSVNAATGGRQLRYAKLSSDEVPQADNIEMLESMVVGISAGHEPTALSMQVDPRQVNYYKHAARVLGLLDESNVLTDFGETLVELKGAQRAAFLMIRFEESTVGRAWAQWAGKPTLLDVSPNTAEAFLIDLARDSLSDNTKARRAKTLANWLTKLASFHYASLT